MKKILFIATVQSHIMNFHLPFIKYFEEKGYKVYSACKLDKHKYKDEMKEQFATVEWVDLKFSRKSLAFANIGALRELCILMRSNDFALVHVHTPIAAYIGRLASYITRTNPVLYTAHGFHFYKGASIKNWLFYYPMEKMASCWTDGLITINEEDYIRAKTRLTVRENKVFKVNGVGVDLKIYNTHEDKQLDFKESLGLRQDDFVITVVAELIYRKNHIQIIEAIEVLVKQYPHIKLMIVGDGCLQKYLEQEVIKRSLEGSIKFLGFRKDVNRILEVTDIVGLFSYQEGLPKILLEAMAMEKAIVCTRIRGNVDLIENGVNGYLVALNNVQETVEKIEDLYKDRDKIRCFGIESKKRIQKYALDTIVQEMDKIYKEFI